MRSPRPRTIGWPARSGARGGFTLLELLISLSMLILLMSAVVASLFLFLRTESSGRERVERAQLVRAIYFRISNDIRAVTFREEIKVAQDEEGVAASEDDPQARDDSYLELVTPEEAYGNRSDGLYGNSTMLVIYTSRPLRTAPKLSVADGSEQDSLNSSQLSVSNYAGSGLRAVAWFLATESSGDFAASAAGAMIGDNEVPFETGLARMDADALDLLYSANELGFDSTGMTGDSRILAPEVTALTFRYFDGIDWTDSWDSRAMERLPNAVEVTLELTPLEDDSEEQSYFRESEPVDERGRLVRFVVALPVAPPPLTEVQL
jgi:type II secretory pathway pseudopilin PulG